MRYVVINCHRGGKTNERKIARSRAFCRCGAFNRHRYCRRCNFKKRHWVRFEKQRCARKTTQHSAKAEGAAIFTVAPERGSESELDPFLRVKVVVNGETAFDGTAEEFFVKGKAEIGVDGSFTFSVTYTLPESVGNEAQGKSSELKIIYSLKSVSLP